jgi:hypothetical protein
MLYIKNFRHPDICCCNIIYYYICIDVEPPIIQTKVVCFDEEITDAKDTTSNNLSWVQVQIKMVYVSAVAVDITVKQMFLGL